MRSGSGEVRRWRRLSNNYRKLFSARVLTICRGTRKELDRQIKEARHAATVALTFEGTLWAEADQGARGPAQPEAALAFRGAGGSGPALLSNHERLP